MARVYYVLGAILLWGIVQADVFGDQKPAFIEDIRGVSSRIVGGWPAQDGQFPHQISLRMVSSSGAASSCGGSIIHHEWVITAAHCVANRITFVVRLGLTNVTRPEYIVETTHKFMHPKYIEQFGYNVQPNDIALVKLEHHINYGPNIQPIRLQNSENKNTNYEGVVLAVSGYGLTDDSWNGGVSEILRWTYLRGINDEECANWFSNAWFVQESTLCAWYYNDTAQSSCQGDSGGPLIQPDVDGKPTMVGIFSFAHGTGCHGPYPTGGVASEILRWTLLRGMTNEECSNWYSNSWIIQASTLCAGYYNDTAQSSCQGDSGGPLIHPDVDGKPSMVGIVSFGSAAGCNSPYPSAYIRPGHYHEWIQDVTGIDFDWKSEDLVASIQHPNPTEDDLTYSVKVAEA